MSMAIGSGSTWANHAAWNQLRTRRQQLQNDDAAGAERQVIAADEAAVRQTAKKVTKLRPGHTIDVTV